MSEKVFVRIDELDPKIFLHLFGNSKIELTHCEQVLFGVIQGSMNQAAADWQEQHERILRVEYL